MQKLLTIFSQDNEQARKKHMEGKKHMDLDGPLMSPAYQRRGLGSALLQWGIERADAERVPCWVQASPSACTVYTRAGFRVVGFTDHELDEWAPGGKG